MNVYIIHPESESAIIIRNTTPEECYGWADDPCAEIVSKEQLYQFCYRYKIQPEIVDENLTNSHS